MEWLVQAGGKHRLRNAQQQKRDAAIRAVAGAAAAATAAAAAAAAGTTSPAISYTPASTASIAPVATTTSTAATVTGAASTVVPPPIIHKHQPVTIKKRGSCVVCDQGRNCCWTICHGCSVENALVYVHERCFKSPKRFPKSPSATAFGRFQRDIRNY